MNQMSKKSNKQIIKDLRGEYYVFHFCYKKLESSIEEPYKRIYLECFLLHARNLYEFLNGKKKHKDDVSITDFIIKRNRLDTLPIDRINVQLSHISYKRLGPKHIDLSNKREEIYKIIKSALSEYDKIVTSEYKIINKN